MVTGLTLLKTIALIVFQPFLIVGNVFIMELHQRFTALYALRNFRSIRCLNVNDVSLEFTIQMTATIFPAVQVL